MKSKNIIKIVTGTTGLIIVVAIIVPVIILIIFFDFIEIPLLNKGIVL